MTLDYYLADPEIRRRSWLLRRAMRDADPQPNAGHAALVDLERQGRLRALVTQNIDGLHQAAGSAPALVHEIHGTVHEVVCVGCGDRTTMRAALDRVAAGEPDPACLVCGGILKSATVYFGQLLDERVLGGVHRGRRRLRPVPRRRHLAAGVARRRAWPTSPCGSGARLASSTPSRPRTNELADLVVREPIGTALPRLVAATAAA